MFLFLSHGPAFGTEYHSGFENCLVEFTFSFIGTFLSQITPVVSLHLLHDSRTVFLQSPSVPPSAANVEPRYLKVFLDGISSSPTLQYHKFVFEVGMFSGVRHLSIVLFDILPCFHRRLGRMQRELHVAMLYSSLFLCVYCTFKVVPDISKRPKLLYAFS